MLDLRGEDQPRRHGAIVEAAPSQIRGWVQSGAAKQAITTVACMECLGSAWSEGLGDV